MKTLLLISTLGISLFLSHPILSQSEWAPVGAKWWYTNHHGMFPLPSEPLIQANEYESVGDTIVAGENCRIITRKLWSNDMRLYEEYMYEENGKVFFYDSIVSGFQLLYDFSAGPSESWTIPGHVFADLIDSLVITVDSVSTVSMSDTTIRIQYVHGDENENTVYYDIIYEGIGAGSKMFFFDCPICEVNFDWGLRCYEDSTAGLIKFDPVDCDYKVWTSIEEPQSASGIKFYPNPATSKSITIDFPDTRTWIDSEWRIKILNVRGEVELDRRYRWQDQIHVLIKDLPAGIHLLTLYNPSSELVETFKMVVIE